MESVFVVADNITSPVGFTTAANFERLTKGVSGVRLHNDKALSDTPVYASLFETNAFAQNEQHTKFEALLIASVADALSKCDVKASDKKTVIIISSTKGNISLLETEENNVALQKRIALSTSAKIVAEHFGFVNEPVVVSNACISGIMATLTGMRLIQSGQFDNAVVVGADVISKFVLSGFQSFQAISAKPCKPFDKDRDGITLGEGAATVILSKNQHNPDDLKVMGGAVSNDANHISAPSRTGAELSYAIDQALKQAALPADAIDFISAHGTATLYNDEMEAKAINLSILNNTPLNSLKGYYGHTLGAAGLIESIIALQSIKDGVIIPTLGFKESGVSTPVNVCHELLKGNYKNCLKTASGFGGCNAAIVFGRG